MVACLGYILYSGVTATFNLVLLLAIIAIFTEDGVLILNRWRCPLTTSTEKHGVEKGSVVNLSLLGVLARNSYKWGTVSFVAGLGLLAVRYFIG